LTPTPQPLTEETLSQMTNEQKLDLAPEKAENYEKSNVSEVFPHLIIYRDNEENAQVVYNLLTKEISTLKEAGIAEFDLDTGEKLEMRFFDNTEEAFAFIVDDVLLMKNIDFQNEMVSQKYPEEFQLGLDAYEIANSIVGVKSNRGYFPSPPENSEEFFYLTIFELKGGGVVISASHNTGAPKFLSFNTLDGNIDRSKIFNLLQESGFFIN
jgi:hypothetical protein